MNAAFRFLTCFIFASLIGPNTNALARTAEEIAASLDDLRAALSAPDTQVITDPEELYLLLRRVETFVRETSKDEDVSIKVRRKAIASVAEGVSKFIIELAEPYEDLSDTTGIYGKPWSSFDNVRIYGRYAMASILRDITSFLSWNWVPFFGDDAKRNGLLRKFTRGINRQLKQVRQENPIPVIDGKKAEHGAMNEADQLVVEYADAVTKRLGSAEPIRNRQWNKISFYGYLSIAALAFRFPIFEPFSERTYMSPVISGAIYATFWIIFAARRHSNSGMGFARRTQTLIKSIERIQIKYEFDCKTAVDTP